VTIGLYYQTTSREYIEFLRNEINGSGPLTLPETAFGVQRPTASPYIIQADPFFGQLRAWGDTIWNLWTHNMNRPGAAPVLMAQATQTFEPTAVHMQILNAQSGESPVAWRLLPFMVLGGVLLAGWLKRRAR
jgi:hypothetical protein